MKTLNQLKFKDYNEYKDFTLEDYRQLWKEQDDHAGLTLYQYLLVTINHSPEGTKIGFVERYLHHNLMKAREAAFQHFQEIKIGLKGKYSIDKEEDYDPDLGISHNYGILLLPTADVSKKITVESTMNDLYNSPDKELDIFNKLKNLNPVSDYMNNIIKEKGLLKMLKEANSQTGRECIHLNFLVVLQWCLT